MPAGMPASTVSTSGVSMPPDRTPRIIDYDDDFDYEQYWRDRDYERWAERHALRRLFRRMEHAHWTIDFGAGFGRNAEHYLGRSDRAVLVDYGIGNLQRAAQRLAPKARSDRLFFVRADLYRLPFIDGSFDRAIVVRVLHHLTDIEAALAEMGRTVSEQWIVDVPIKHHLLAQVRGVLHRDRARLRGGEPLSVSSTGEPFVNFRLQNLVEVLRSHGWTVRRAASVNNFRRWDQVASRPVVASLTPLVQLLEILLQQVGRGWWGPSQFLTLERSTPNPRPPSSETGLMAVVVCPVCRVRPVWSEASAHCSGCERTYRRIGEVWDLVPR